MKKITVLVLMQLLIIGSVVSAAAYDPPSWYPFGDAEDYAIQGMIYDYNKHIDNGDAAGEKLKKDKSILDVFFNVGYFYSESDANGESHYYYLINFTSPDAEDAAYFERFGSNHEFYMRSAKTGKVYPAGWAVFDGDPDDVDSPQVVVTLEQIAETNPLLIDAFSKWCATDEVGRAGDIGRMGDVNGDGAADIRDATAIQRSLAEFSVLDAKKAQIADMDGDGIVKINDVTALQRAIAE